jgi:hypothetical protein
MDGPLRVRVRRGTVLRPVNWRKRLAKAEDNHLRPGEHVLATMVLQVKGAVARGAFIGGLLGARRAAVGATTVYVPSGAIAKRYPEGARYPVEGLAGQFPVKPLLLVLTDHDRVVVYSFVLVRLTLTYEMELRASQLLSIEIGWGVFARKATLRFNDGSHLTFDLPRMHEHKPFCRRFLRGRPE